MIKIPADHEPDKLEFPSSSDICSPLTEVEPDYSTDNSDEDNDEEEEDEKLGVGHHDDGNIYEQVRKNPFGKIYVRFSDWEGY